MKKTARDLDLESTMRRRGVVSHVFLFVGLAWFAKYSLANFPSQALSREQQPQGVSLSVWALALFPTSFFMVMAYSESLCLTLTVLFMWGIKRNWPVAVLALLAGLSIAARPVGVALLPPLIMHLSG